MATGRHPLALSGEALRMLRPFYFAIASRMRCIMCLIPLAPDAGDSVAINIAFIKNSLKAGFKANQGKFHYNDDHGQYERFGLELGQGA